MSYSTYKEYAQSGHSHIGAIPYHWDVLRAKFLFRRENRPPRDKDEIVTAFRDGQVTLRSNRRTDGFTVALKEIGYQGVRKGDFIIHAMDGFAGAIGISDSDGKSSPVYSVCTPSNADVVPAYYALYLRTLALNGFIESLAKGVRERSTEFRFAEFKEVLFPFPARKEQLQIATFLDRETAKIDCLIEKQQRLIKLLEEKRQAVISHAVTKGLNPDVPMKDSGVEWLGDVPLHWYIKPVKRVCTLNDDTLAEETSPDLEFEYVDIGSVSAGEGINQTTKMTFSDAPSRARRLVKSGDVIVSTVRTYLRAIAAIEENATQLVVSTGFCVVRPGACLDNKYCAQLLQSSYFIEQVVAESVGVSYPAINSSELGNIHIPIPPRIEQVEISSHISQQLAKIRVLREKSAQAIKLLNERRTALISAAVSGKIDVRDQVPQDVEEAVAS